jgi:hypothetical protein
MIELYLGNMSRVNLLRSRSRQESNRAFSQRHSSIDSVFIPTLKTLTSGSNVFSTDWVRKLFKKAQIGDSTSNCCLSVADRGS